MPAKKQSPTSTGKGKNTKTIAAGKKTTVAKKSKKKTNPIILPVIPLLEI